MLKELQGGLFGNKTIFMWEHIIDCDEPECLEACTKLRALLNKI